MSDPIVTPEMLAAAWAAWHVRHGGKLGPGPAFAEAIKAALAASPQPPAPSVLEPGCFDCRRPYGDEHGFPDLLLPHDIWHAVSPDGEGNGLLCPSCICGRLHNSKLRCEGVFTSGPLAGEHRVLFPDTAAIRAAIAALPWLPYPQEDSHSLNDVLVIGQVQRFAEDGPAYGNAMGERTGAVATAEAARELVVERIVSALANQPRSGGGG